MVTRWSIIRFQEGTMFPFGIFPFNILPMYGPWWPLQVIQAQDNMPPAAKAWLEAWAAWAAIMARTNPWLADRVPPESAAKTRQA